MNSPQSSCPRVEQAIGLVLHALEPGEEMDVLAHLPTCPECQAAARDAGEILGALGSTVEQVDPPPRLRASILDAAARTPQQSAAHDDVVSFPEPSRAVESPRSGPAPMRPQRGRPSTGPTSPGTPAGPGRSGPPRVGSGSHRAPQRRTRLLAAGLALVVALGLGGLVARTVQLQQQRDAQVEQTQTIFDMVAQFDKPGAQHAWLATSPGTTPIAAVMVDGTTRQIVTVGLPANSAATDTYVLWGVGNGDPKPIGTFDVGSTQSGPHDIGSNASAGGYGGYAISIEPGRTAPASPTKVVASGQVEI